MSEKYPSRGLAQTASTARREGFFVRHSKKTTFNVALEATRARKSNFHAGEVTRLHSASRRMAAATCDQPNVDSQPAERPCRIRRLVCDHHTVDILWPAIVVGMGEGKLGAGCGDHVSSIVLPGARAARPAPPLGSGAGHGPWEWLWRLSVRKPCRQQRCNRSTGPGRAPNRKAGGRTNLGYWCK